MVLLDQQQENEVLSKILKFVSRSKYNEKSANNLIRQFGSLKQVFDADKQELNDFVSEKEASLISFIRECSKIYTSLKIKESSNLSSPQEVVDYLKACLSAEKVEKLYLILLNANNRLIKSIEVETGTENKSVVLTRKIAKLALKNNAVSSILAHNHPSGSLKPSQNDINATKAVKSALETIDTSLLDHIIIAGTEYTSLLRNTGLFKAVEPQKSV